eukprot:1194600-Prorocentrum_minimum.AAC.5
MIATSALSNIVLSYFVVISYNENVPRGLNWGLVWADAGFLSSLDAGHGAYPMNVPDGDYASQSQAPVLGERPFEGGPRMAWPQEEAFPPPSEDVQVRLFYGNVDESLMLACNCFKINMPEDNNESLEAMRIHETMLRNAKRTH